MSEIIAKVGSSKTVELTLNGTSKMEGSEPLSPEDAFFLARSLIACALAAVSGGANIGAMVADAHIPIQRWAVGTSDFAKAPSLQLGLPHGIELTFLLSEVGAQKLGAALVARGQNKLSPEQGHGTVH